MRGKPGSTASGPTPSRWRARFFLPAAVRFLSMGAVFLMLTPGASLALVGKTKHNFGSLSPAEVISLDSTEICVFCHTPHNSKPGTPIWNKELSGENYDAYQSETIVAA